MGWHHIIDINAYDHLLFVIVLCASFLLRQWKQILVLVTAFTLGHSITLILSSLNYIPNNSYIIEILIPITIMITAISNVVNYQKKGGFYNRNVKYGIALLFGLIHGLAFASSFKMMMFKSNLLVPLLGFNLGIEFGQLLIVLVFMMLLFVFTKIIKGDHFKWNTFVSGAAFGIAILLLKNVI